MTRDIYEDGLTIRRKMLGDAWVDRSLANRNDFNAEIQQQITRQALGRSLDAAGHRSEDAPLHGDVDYDRAARVGRIPLARAFRPDSGRPH
jgi:hypothetical protein